ncbi:ABC transporter ATP-binding protein [Arthrobacter sp. H35-D1]|uniref:ABC transporter ATP-binding protein n=1 Tax=Arthrobacter sp. H35-D1 TaxID=3046202 RepID=UPI0024BBAAD0|nr:ABC transporter ATP-binding protein [Arthrobacter sp. H35-D1]MDJ0314053.1 ABC transporter ATP-binding protein [Arthrobacter sp. H35-D1]
MGTVEKNGSTGPGRPILAPFDLKHSYGVGGAGVQALDGVDFELAQGELVVILGPSGSGKSTLLNVVGTLEEPDSGTVEYLGTPVNHRRRRAVQNLRRERIGFVFQAYNLVPTLNARDNILLGGEAQRPGPHLEGLAEELGISALLSKFPTELSGGEQQRVAIARALVKRPVVLFCDEPTGALDTSNSQLVLELLRSYRSQHGTSIVMVTHNPQIAELADRVLTMRDGKIVAQKRTESPLTVDEIEWV